MGSNTHRKMTIESKQPEFIEHLDIGIETYSVTNEKPHFQVNAVELLLCLSGNVTVTVSHMDYELSKGDFVAINPNEVHYSKSDNDNIIVSFYFNACNQEFQDIGLKDIYLDNIQDNTNPDLINLKKDILKKLMAILFYTLNGLHSDEYTKLISMSKETLGLLIDNFQLFYIADSGAPHSEESKQRFNRIISHLIANYDRKITMDEISSTEHISSNYLSQYIKKATMMGLTNILAFIRTHESERILLSKDIGIIDVAYECGFSDQKLYYKAFKNLYNCTPNQHREAIQKLVEESSSNKIIDVNKERKRLEHEILLIMASCS